MTHLVPLALAALLAAGAGYDTVLLQNGGRVVGTVVEENPATGVTVQIPGGQLRTVPAAEVFRIEYRDGTFGVLGARPGATPPPDAATAPPEPARAAAPADAAAAGPAVTAAPAPDGAGPADAAPPAGPQAQAAPPPPVAPGQEVYPAVPVYPQGPPPPPPPAPWAGRPRAGRPGPVMLSIGVGLAVPAGDAEAGYSMADTLTPQLLIEMEGGVRFTPWIMGSLVLDLGVGDSAGSMRDLCHAQGGSDCTAVTARFGVQLRYTFEPMAPATGWVSIGTGVEATSVTFDGSGSGDDFTYTGWEALRLGAGYDFRTSPSGGLGLFASAGLGTYDEYEVNGVRSSVSSTRTHAWIQAGVRIILFP